MRLFKDWQVIAKEAWYQDQTAAAAPVEPPVPEGKVRVYHSGQAPTENETGRWVSTNKQYASDYRSKSFFPCIIWISTRMIQG